MVKKYQKKCADKKKMMHTLKAENKERKEQARESFGRHTQTQEN